MAYLPRDERRVAIVDATLRVIRRDGFGAVSARAVAQELGGSPGLIHQHFPSVQELVATAWRGYVSENLAEFSGAMLHREVDPLAEFFANHLDPSQGAELWIWADAWAHALRSPEFAAVFAETLSQLTGALCDAAPDVTEVGAERAVLLGVALAGAQRIAPERYGVERLAAIIAESSPGVISG